MSGDGPLTFAEFLALARKMRQAQRRYYKVDNSREQLDRCRALEGEFDRAIESAPAPAPADGDGRRQASLFEDPPPERTDGPYRWDYINGGLR